MFCFVCYKEKWGERNGEKNMGFFLFEGKRKLRMGGESLEWNKRWDPLNFIDDSHVNTHNFIDGVNTHNFIDGVNTQNFAT